MESCMTLLIWTNEGTGRVLTPLNLVALTARVLAFGVLAGRCPVPDSAAPVLRRVEVQNLPASAPITADFQKSSSNGFRRDILHPILISPITFIPLGTHEHRNEFCNHLH